MKTSSYHFALILLVSMLFCMENNAYCQNTGNFQLPDYPKYSDVISRFLSEYSISEIAYPDKFSLAKKPGGWYAIITDMTNETVVTDQVYWDRQEGKYKETDFPSIPEFLFEENNEEITNDWASNYFTGILPYWGYTGWDKDIIDEYESKPNLSNTLLNALARAYCSYASNLLNNNTGFSSREVRFNLPDGQNSLTSEQIARYREFEHKGIESYYKLWQTNPAFETFVADVYNLYSNEIMNSYLTILYHQNYEEARKELRKGLYDSFIKDMAVRILDSCEPEAILFVNGDIDTYSLLYLQESEGFRKDVTVINIGMLNNKRYLSYILGNTHGSEPLRLRFPADLYRDKTKQFFYILENRENITADEMIDFVASPDPGSKLSWDDQLYDYIPARHIIIEVDISNLPQRVSSSYNELLSLESQINIELQGSYILPDHFFIMDLLNSNHFSRPVCFAITVDQRNFLGLQDYFRCDGMVYTITPFRKVIVKDDSSIGYIDTELQFKKLIDNAPSHVTDTLRIFFPAHRMLTYTYRNVYNNLAGQLIDEGKTDSALIVLDYCASTFSSDKVGHNYFSVGLMESYYRLDHEQEANNIAEAMLQTILRDMEQLQQSENMQEYEIMLGIETLRRLEECTGQYVADSELHRKISAAYNSINRGFLQ
mgnify:FL=1